jgi:GTPase
MSIENSCPTNPTNKDENKKSGDVLIVLKEIKEMFPNLYFKEIRCVLASEFKLPPETELKFIEYKRRILNATQERLLRYATQMQYRIENNMANFAVYFIGVEDNGSISGVPLVELLPTVEVFSQVAKNIQASIAHCEFIQIMKESNENNEIEASKIVVKFKVKGKKKTNNLNNLHKITF